MMTAMTTFRMHTMSQTSAGSADASACYTSCTSARTAFYAIINILDAIILASIFVMIFLVSLRGLSNSLVVLVLVNLAVLLVFRHRITPKR